MLKLKVVAPMGARVPAGTVMLGLDPAQLRRRAHLLAPAANGAPLAAGAVGRDPVFFKAGETVGFQPEAEHVLAAGDWADGKGLTLGQRHVMRKEADRAARKKALAAADAAAKKSADETEKKAGETK